METNRSCSSSWLREVYCLIINHLMRKRQQCLIFFVYPVVWFFKYSYLTSVTYHVKDVSVPKDALEVKSILEKVDSMVGEAELSEKISNNAHVFSNAGIQSLITSIKSFGIHTFESAIYTFSLYTFIITANQKQYRLVDTHPVPVNSNGNGNVLVILSKDKFDYSVMQLAVWLLQRIARSSTGQIFHQPFPSRHTMSFQRLCNVYTTSLTWYRRRIDVETTPCVYWVTVINFKDKKL